MKKEITKEECMNLFAELILREDIRVEVVMSEHGKPEELKIKVKTEKTEKEQIKIEKKCIEILKNFGIPCNLNGYKYTLTAMKLVNEDISFMEAISRKLYPKIANEHQTTVGRVEHGIRHAIKVAYSNNEALFKANFQTKKPTNSLFVAHVTEVLRYQIEEESLEAPTQTCKEMLKRFNISQNLKGYKYLMTSIEMVYNDFSILESVTKLLYPDVAKKFKTTTSVVEHAMRGAINKAYQKDKKVFEEAFPHGTNRPTNTQFISQLADMLKYEI